MCGTGETTMGWVGSVLLLVPTPSMWGPGRPSPVGRGTHFLVGGVRSAGGVAAEIFLGRPPICGEPWCLPLAGVGTYWGVKHTIVHTGLTVYSCASGCVAYLYVYVLRRRRGCCYGCKACIKRAARRAAVTVSRRQTSLSGLGTGGGGAVGRAHSCWPLSPLTVSGQGSRCRGLAWHSTQPLPSLRVSWRARRRPRAYLARVAGALAARG